MKRFASILWVLFWVAMVTWVVPRVNHWAMNSPQTTFGRLQSLERRVTALERRCPN
jgi:hypothetical protein